MAAIIARRHTASKNDGLDVEDAKYVCVTSMLAALLANLAGQRRRRGETRPGEPVPALATPEMR